MKGGRRESGGEEEREGGHRKEGEEGRMCHSAFSHPLCQLSTLQSEAKGLNAFLSLQLPLQEAVLHPVLESRTQSALPNLTWNGDRRQIQIERVQHC